MSMPIEAKGAEVVSVGRFSGCHRIVFADYPRGGSSRSIPLADIRLCTVDARLLRGIRTVASARTHWSYEYTASFARPTRLRQVLRPMAVSVTASSSASGQ